MRSMGLAMMALLLFCGCNSGVGTHVRDFEYDMQWSVSLFLTTSVPPSAIQKIEVYMERPGNGYPIPYKVLNLKTPVWVAEDVSDVNEFMAEIKREPVWPKGAVVAGNDLTLHIVIMGVDGKIGYATSRWHIHGERQYGFTLPFGATGSYKYTDSLLPWLNQRTVGTMRLNGDDR